MCSNRATFLYVWLKSFIPQFAVENAKIESISVIRTLNFHNYQVFMGKLGQRDPDER